MKSASAGKLEITVSEGGWPIWCSITHQGAHLETIKDEELLDLQHAVKMAIWHANELRRRAGEHLLPESA